MAAKKQDHDLASNNKAFYHYEIIEMLEAGIALTGTEVKSLRDHGGNITDSYVIVSSGKAILKNASIAAYRFGNIHNHEEKRERVLLLHKQELVRLENVTQQKGLTVIPLALYLKKGKIKVKLGIAKGKKAYDKRESIKEREHKQSMARAIKQERE
ncbi:MAG: SsrA-binding protein SmpB [Chlamydiae bacterium]|nr:SsrA-binding protein SmpB [Chlamydiota bacterium]